MGRRRGGGNSAEPPRPQPFHAGQGRRRAGPDPAGSPFPAPPRRHPLLAETQHPPRSLFHAPASSVGSFDPRASAPRARPSSENAQRLAPTAVSGGTAGPGPPASAPDRGGRPLPARTHALPRRSPESERLRPSPLSQPQDEGDHDNRQPGRANEHQGADPGGKWARQGARGTNPVCSFTS